MIRLEKGEERKTEIARVKGKKLTAPALVFGLERLGWQRGGAHDAGMFVEHTRYFRAAGVTAVIEYDGFVSMNNISSEEELELKTCFFLEGLYVSGDYSYKAHPTKLKLGDIDPIVISETLNDLTQLTSTL